MLAAIALLALLWLVLAVVGSVVTGWFWLTLVGLALLLATGAVGAAVHRPKHPGI